MRRWREALRAPVSGACAVIIGAGWPAHRAGAVELQGDAERGSVAYHQCTGCHSIDADDIGPRHRGVVGRRAASVADYPYSAALKASGLTWDRATLDRWLEDPSALVPGTKMFFKVDAAQDRADIIAFLTSLR